MSGTGPDLAELARPASRIFTTRDGLPQNTVQALAFDRRGYLWAGTQDGAARYNGRSWLSVAMPNRRTSNFVGAICPTSDGAVWFGTNGGGVIRLFQEQWTVFDSSLADIPNDQVRCLVETRRRNGEPVLWAGTRGGIACRAGGAWQTFADGSRLPNDVVRSILHSVLPDGTRSLVVGTRGGLARFVGRDVVEVVDASNGLPNDVVTCLLETDAPDGTRILWVGTERGLAVCRSGRWIVVDESTGLAGDAVSSLAATRDRDGQTTVWVGTDNGLSRFTAGRWNSWRSDDGLPSNAVMSLLPGPAVENAASIWVGSHGSGLGRIELGGWRTISHQHGLPNKSVWSILDARVPDGNHEIWMGTLGGGAAVWHDAWTVHDTSNGLTDDAVVALAAGVDASRSEIFAGLLAGGLCRWDGTAWSAVDAPEPVANNAVLSVLEARGTDGGHTLWVGTNGGGLARRTAAGWTVWDTRSGLPNNVVVCLLETHDASGTSLWAGTNGGGLARFRRGAWTVYDTSTGLPNNLVMGLAETRDAGGRRTLWVGTEGGGVATCDLDAKSPEWSGLSTASTPPITSDVVYQVLQDRQGRVFLFTNRGVDRLTPRTPSRARPAAWDVYAYSVEDGLPAPECNSGAAHRDHLGRIWVGTGEGAAVLLPDTAAAEHAAAEVVIERARIEQRDDDIHAGEALAYDENDVTFEYTLLGFFREESTRFRTQLVGFDQHVSEWSSDFKRSYTNLPHGSYHFKVWAMDFAGRVTGPAELRFSVRPAPWRRWWAYGLYAGAASGAAYAGIRLRLDALRRRNEELERAIAERTAQLAEKIDELQVSEQRALESERHALDASRAKSVFLSSMSHELRTPLNAILGFVQVMRRAEHRNAEDHEHLDIVSRSGEHLLGLINDVLSISKIEAGKLSLNSETFDLFMLMQGISEMIAVRASAKGIALNVERDGSVPRHVTGDEGKLRQVLINLLGNAVKFTSAGSVTLQVSTDGDRIRFSVADTGHGIGESELNLLFQPFQQTESGQQTGDGTGLGLAISQSFVALMGGTITVESRLGVGSTFSFDVNLPVSGEIAPERAEPVVTGVEPDQPSYRMLVVDDTEANRLLLRKILEPFGFEMREASNGRDALAEWEAWRPDVVWLDMRLPVLSGVDATREIRRLQTSPCTIIALTASAFDHDRAELLEAGCDGFVAKPYRESEIFEALERHVGIRFVRRDAGAALETDLDAVAAGLSSRLGSLTDERRTALRDASTHGDLAATAAIIDAISSDDEQLAVDLRALLRAYRFDEILAAL
ncbi:MAG TPA: ATP-binding protein [Blastocatellia bacterium]|nr:ATP-binding protein [Blastocatellia bacterium]